MFHYTYIIKCISPNIKKSYVGYSNNPLKRLKKHNSGKGAKSTKGKKWTIVFLKKFNTKNEAMSYEYMLKKNRILRKKILESFD